MAGGGICVWDPVEELSATSAGALTLFTNGGIFVPIGVCNFNSVPDTVTNE